jgi:glycerol-3-phosphate acyltransferase PlsY
MEQIFVVVVAYFVGSIPFAFLLSRRRGIDLREVGSGNVGAANVLRTSGPVMGVAAMLLDALKGVLAVVVAQRVAGGPATAVAAGLASVVGHIYPVWLRFHGGKGVATAAGVFGVLTPSALAAASAVFLLAVWVTRFVSVGSMAAALTVAILAAVGDTPGVVAAGAAIIAAIIINRHRTNLARLVAGTERKLEVRRRKSEVSKK